MTTAPSRATLLRGLRLNCRLAPGIIALVAAVLVLCAGWYAAQQSAQRVDAERRAELATIAKLIAAGSLRLVDWQAASTWLGAAHVHVDGTRTIVDERAGQPPTIPVDDVRPEYITAVQQPSSWQAGDGMRGVAAPIAQGARTTLLLAWYTVAEPIMPASAWVVAIVILVLGVVLGEYLVRRIWRPIESLAHAAESALLGQGSAALQGSRETDAVVASVITVVDRYRNEHPSGDPETIASRSV